MLVADNAAYVSMAGFAPRYRRPLLVALFTASTSAHAAHAEHLVDQRPSRHQNVSDGAKHKVDEKGVP